jgi:hypothetical protein
MRKWIVRGVFVVVNVCAAEAFLNALCAISPRACFALWADRDPRKSLMVSDEDLLFRGNPLVPEHDRLGFRNSEVPDSVDIVALGDSTTYGLHVAPTEAWPQQIAQRTGLSVYNMGFPGWGAVQYRATFERSLALKPRFVIVGFYLGNDVFDAFHATYHSRIGEDLRGPFSASLIADLERRKPIPTLLGPLVEAAPPSVGGLRRFLSDHSKLYGLARGLRNRGRRLNAADPSLALFGARTWAEMKSIAAAKPNDLSVFESTSARTVFTAPIRLLAVDQTDRRIAEGLRVTLKAFAQMARRCELANCRLLVVMIPMKEMVFEPFVSAPSEHVGFEQLMHATHQMQKQVGDLCSAERIEFTDATSPMQYAVDTIGNPYFETPDSHPNDKGHATVAIHVIRTLKLEVRH